ncbi:hypothetical protein GN244_ATG11810 [Phytophthora infestans]|uniref:Secreted RxLR effector peptide protein n=1 Tax=Phytophthora infestans TaxID=4787 RepID=A0A833WB67_PHYIN|nr:hypothetical protein GN244_ATG11810 [Phytophthora infestans]
MRISFGIVLAAIVVVTSCLESIAAENVTDDVPTLKPAETSGHLKGTQAKTEKEPHLVNNAEEERAMTPAIDRLKSLLPKHLKSMDKKSFSDRVQASKAIRKVKSVLGTSGKKDSIKVTPEKVKELQTYARENPGKWEALTNYATLAEWAAVLGLNVIFVGLLFRAVAQG